MLKSLSQKNRARPLYRHLDSREGCLVVIGSGEALESKGFSKVCRCKSLCRHWLCEGLVIFRFCDHEMLKLEDLVFRESSAHRGEIQRVEIL